MDGKLDIQGTNYLEVTARQNQRVNRTFRIETATGTPINVEDATACTFVVRRINSTGPKLLELTLGNGVTIADNIITIDAAAPQYEHFQGGAWFSLTITTPAWGVRSLIEGTFTVLAWNQ